MTQAAFDQGDWEAVIRAHALESSDSEDWLRYGIALLHTLKPGPQLGQQHQQAALAFLQASKAGASQGQIQAVQRQAVLLCLREVLALADLQLAQPPVYPGNLSHCIWQSQTPYADLIRLGRWALQQPPTSTTATQELAEVAWRTRDPLLVAEARERLSSNPLDPPWTAYFQFLLLSTEQPGAVAGLLPAALRLQRQAELHGQAMDEPVRRLMAAVIGESGDPSHAHIFKAVIAALGPGEPILYGDPSEAQLVKVFATALALSPEEACNAARLYALAGPSLRKPWVAWHDPAAAEWDPLDRLLSQLLRARRRGEGYSAVRLGDGEGLFLAGKRPDLGGALRNGVQPDEAIRLRDYQLSEEHQRSLQQQLLLAICGADWIGIPDLQQCLIGPPDYISVASSLGALLPAAHAAELAGRLMPGGCHLHNFLLYGGAYAKEPFCDVQAVIAPSLPMALQDQPGLKWAAIPGELHCRDDAVVGQAHYPAVFEQTLEWIKAWIVSGDLVLVAAGILGKIYCQQVKEQGGIAVDIGSVVDLCSGHSGTRGEYRLHPYLVHAAEAAFRRAC
jgi:hypothetical protein